jgi:Tol biopolymer transport system component
MRVWAPDGKHIFGEFLSKDEPRRLIRVSADNGSRDVVEEFERMQFFTVDISPDGRYLAYDVADSKGSNRDIVVLDLEGNRELPLVTHAANDKLLGWTPDGRHIFFASDRNGTWDGWLLRVEDGTPRGLPEMIKAGLGNVSPAGFTRSGAFYCQRRHQGWNVYVARLDPDTGEVRSEPSPVRLVGKDVWPDWSPDGQYLAYCSESDREKAQIIRIRTLATGQERELKPDLPRFEYLRWCPDSRHLLITNFSGESPSVIYRLAAATGDYTALVRSDQRKIRQAELSADGKTLAYRIRGRGTMNRLIVRSLETGNEKEVLQTPTAGALALAPGSGWALSPDGKHVALSIREEAGKPFVLKIMSVESGEYRTLDTEWVFQMAWTRDGRDLLVTKNVKELWRVSAEGGVPEKILDWKEMIMGPRIHPDGRHIAFFSGARMSELWVMENFLPAAVARASR